MQAELKTAPEATDVESEDSSSLSGYEGSSVLKDLELQSDELDQITEKDTEDLEQKPIPYNRFREVNEKAKHLAREKEHIEAKHDEDIRRITREYEAKLEAKGTTPQDTGYNVEYEENSEMNNLKKTIQGLQGELSTVRKHQTKTSREMELEKLTTKFPKADKMAVLGWKQVMPESPLEELMERSHTDNMKMVKDSIKDLLSKKAESAKKGIPVGHAPLKVSKEDRPKSFKDASRLARQYLNQF